MTWTALLLLVLCNLFWSSNPIAAKVLVEHHSALQVSLLRYGSALLVVVLLARWRKASLRGLLVLPREKTQRWVLFLLGFLAFCFSPLFQYSGVAHTQATDNALMIAMEPLLTVLLARLVLGERLALAHWISLPLSVGGFFLLSGIRGSGFQFSGHFFGNALILISLLGEAAYSVLGRKLVQSELPDRIFTTALLIGVLCLGVASVGNSFLLESSSNAVDWTWKEIAAVLWLGPLGTTLAYGIWLRIAVRASVASMVATVFVQPIVGTFLGFWLLGERLSLERALGGVLIVLGLLAQVFLEQRALRKNEVA